MNMAVAMLASVGLCWFGLAPTLVRSGSFCPVLAYSGFLGIVHCLLFVDFGFAFRIFIQWLVLVLFCSLSCFVTIIGSIISKSIRLELLAKHTILKQSSDI
jgi:hypothetical protein